MNRINQLFNSNKKDLLSIYFCAGDPTLDGTADVIRTLEKHGVSMIEVGIPFSDPMADGIVIQNAATQALRNGMSLKVLFEQLCSSDSKISVANAWSAESTVLLFLTFPSMITRNAIASLPNVTALK